MKFKDGDKIKAEHFNEFAAKANQDLANVKLPTGQPVVQGPDFVIEFRTGINATNSINGTVWYRKYRSGWVEQGGRIVLPRANTGTIRNVGLSVRMKDTNYSIIVGSVMNCLPSTSSWVGAGVKADSIQRGQFQIFSERIPETIEYATTWWEVKGMSE